MEPKAEKRPSRISGKWESTIAPELHTAFQREPDQTSWDPGHPSRVLCAGGDPGKHREGLWVSDTVGEAAEHRDNPVGPTALEAKGFHLYF